MRERERLRLFFSGIMKIVWFDILFVDFFFSIKE